MSTEPVPICPILYRPTTLEDHAAITEIRLAVRENALSDPSKVTYADFVAYVTDIGRGWVAETKTDIIGFSFANRSGLIWALFVRPGHEGHGVGTALLNECLKWLRDQGVKRAFLDTDPGTRAEVFYRRKGWIAEIEAPTRIDFSLDLSAS